MNMNYMDFNFDCDDGNCKSGYSDNEITKLCDDITSVINDMIDSIPNTFSTDEEYYMFILDTFKILVEKTLDDKSPDMVKTINFLYNSLEERIKSGKTMDEAISDFKYSMVIMNRIINNNTNNEGGEE